MCANTSQLERLFDHGGNRNAAVEGKATVIVVEKFLSNKTERVSLHSTKSLVLLPKLLL